MKKVLLILSIGLLIFAGFKTVDRNEKAAVAISESEHLVMATLWFQKSAEMRACYYQAYALATYKLKDRLAQSAGAKKPAVVLDIDETVLDNSPYEKYLIDHGTLYASDTWKNWTDKGTANALPGAVEFTTAAKNMGVAVFYISNRKQNEMASTLKNLAEKGFVNADSNFVLLRTEKTGDKTARRKAISDSYEILLLIGDNLTDFEEVFAERDANLGFQLVDENRELFGEKYIILPNPMYGEWEGAAYGNNYSLTAQKKRALRKKIITGF